MREQIIRFGDGDRISGILTATENVRAGPAVIFLNAGIVHRIGPNRLHVLLARAAAAAGFPALRFDMSGLGETPAAPPGLGYEEQAVADTRAAIMSLRNVLGERPIVLAGICSGADNAYLTALQEPRVRGLFLLDPYAYQSTGAKVSDLARRAQDPERWKRLAGRLVGGGEEVPPVESTEEIHVDDNDRIAPPRDAFGRDLELLAGRDVRMLLRYSAAVRHLINAPDQFFRTFSDFDLRGHVEVQVLSDIDHTYTELSAQRELQDRLVSWLSTLP